MQIATPLRRTRVVFFGEGTSLAHTVRPLELAAALDPTRYEVHFCCDPRYRKLVFEQRLTYHPLHCVSPELFRARVFKASALYEEAEYANYIEQDLQLIEALRPDVVVGDFHLSLSTAAEIANVPSITLANAYWSPEARLPIPVPDHPLVSLFGVWVTRQIMRIASGFFFKLQVRGINRLRRSCGLEPLENAQELFTRGTRSLYLDLPQLFGLPARLSSREQVVGPVSWEPAIDLPAWWDALDTRRPVVVVTSGSSGGIDATLEAVEGLLQTGSEVVLATAGRIPLERVPAGVWACDYLPGNKAARRADLVVCNGGIASYQALGAGVPVLGIPLNIDQHYLTDGVQRMGAGLSLRAGQVKAETVRESAERLLGAGSYRQAAKELQRQIQATDPVSALARTVDVLRGKGTQRLMRSVFLANVPTSSRLGESELSKATS